MDVMSIKDEHVACFGSRCSDPFPSSLFPPRIPVQLACPDDRHQASIMINIAPLTPASTLVISSREIAKLTDKGHKNVLADIRVMLAGLDLRSAIRASLPEAYGHMQTDFKPRPRPRD